MKISKYLTYFLRDFLVICICFMVITAILSSSLSIGTVNISLMFQSILIALAFTFYKFALVNHYGLEEKTQRYSFYICFVLASMMIILWLVFFVPSVDKSLLITSAFIIVITKGLVYVMMHIDSQAQAKQLNEKLGQAKIHGSK